MRSVAEVADLAELYPDAVVLEDLGAPGGDGRGEESVGGGEGGGVAVEEVGARQV